MVLATNSSIDLTLQRLCVKPWGPLDSPSFSNKLTAKDSDMEPPEFPLYSRDRSDSWVPPDFLDDSITIGVVEADRSLEPYEFATPTMTPVPSGFNNDEEMDSVDIGIQASNSERRRSISRSNRTTPSKRDPVVKIRFQNERSKIAIINDELGRDKMAAQVSNLPEVNAEELLTGIPMP